MVHCPNKAGWVWRTNPLKPSVMTCKPLCLKKTQKKGKEDPIADSNKGVWLKKGTRNKDEYSKNKKLKCRNLTKSDSTHWVWHLRVWWRIKRSTLTEYTRRSNGKQVKQIKVEQVTQSISNGGDTAVMPNIRTQSHGLTEYTRITWCHRLHRG